MWHKILSKSSYNIIYRVWISSHVSQVFQDLGCRAINYSRYRYDFISMRFFQTIIIQIFLNIHVHKYLFTGHDGSLLPLKWVDFEFDELPSGIHHYTSWCKYSITKNCGFCSIVKFKWSQVNHTSSEQATTIFHLIKLLLKMLRISPLVINGNKQLWWSN